MSSENLNEFNDHTNGDNDDILKHIDDDSQIECMEKVAPKAKEEILNINQDSDSGAENEIDILPSENNTSHCEDIEVMETLEEGSHEKVICESDIINEEQSQEFQYNTENDKYTDDSSNDKDLNELDINNDQVCENIEHEEIGNENSTELDINNDEVCENIEHEEIRNENSTDDSNNDKELNELDINDDQKFKNVEHEEIENEKSNDDIYQQIDEQAKIDTSYNEEHVEECNENITNIENSIEMSGVEENEHKMIQYDEAKDELQNEIDTEHLTEISSQEISNDTSIDISNNKVSEDKRSKDIKALSSTYNNDDNINCDCEICNKTVYPLEKISANNHIYHKQCFRCSKCRCALLAGNFSFNNDKPYCRPHYIELFKKRGRYDEIDDGETNNLPTNINDILTDDLPAQDITKNLLAKFRDLESGASGITTTIGIISDGTDELPAPNTTKNLTERFSALGKEMDREKNEQKRKPMIEIPRSENDSTSGACENQPLSLSKDVVRASEPGQDEMPEQGITRNLVNRFRDLESAGVVSK